MNIAHKSVISKAVYSSPQYKCTNMYVCILPCLLIDVFVARQACIICRSQRDMACDQDCGGLSKCPLLIINCSWLRTCVYTCICCPLRVSCYNTLIPVQCTAFSTASQLAVYNTTGPLPVYIALGYFWISWVLMSKSVAGYVSRPLFQSRVRVIKSSFWCIASHCKGPP